MAPDSLLTRLTTGHRQPWLRRLASVVLTLGIVLLVVYALHHALGEVDYQRVLHYMARTPQEALWLAVAASAASYLVLTGYDFSALRYLRLQGRLPCTAVGVTSFMAYTLTNTVGLGVLAGGAVRMRMFTQWGLTPMQVTRLIAFNAVAFTAGLTLYAAVAVLMEAQAVAALAWLPADLLRGGALAVLAVAVLLLVACARGKVLRWGSLQLALPSLPLALRQLLITGADTLFAALTLWFLLPGGDLSWWTFFTFFMLALAAGVISHVPGGLGVFEVVMLTGLGGALSASSLAAALVLYRVVYYLLPLVAASMLMGGYALWLRVASRSGRGAEVARRHPTSLGIAQGLAWVAPLLLGTLTFTAGVVLLVSGAIPASQGAEGLRALHVPEFMIEASHLIGSICGLLLLVLARGIVYRLDAAWWLALMVAGIAFWMTLPKGFHWVELSLLGALLGLLLLSRGAFNRHSSLVAMRFEYGWLVAIAATLAATGWIVYFTLEHEAWSHAQWWQFALDPQAPRGLRAGMLVAIAALVWGSWQLLRRPPRTASGQVVERAPESADSGLDWRRAATRVFHAPDGQVCLHYRVFGRSWVVLRDPEGVQDAWPDALRAFIDTARSDRMRPAFFQRPSARPDLLLDAGLQLRTVGQALVLDLGGPAAPRQPASLPSGVTVELLHGDAVEASDASLLAQLQSISRQWTQAVAATRRRLSPAPLDAAHLRESLVAVLREQGQVVAFATLYADIADAPAQASPQPWQAALTLVRSLPGADAASARTLQLLHGLLPQLSHLGCRALDLGLLPCQAEEGDEASSNWQRTAREVLHHGELFYQLDPAQLPADWIQVRQPRELAAQDSVSGWLVLADLAPVVRRKRA
ncbi:phosphatidylglycerol lysyltransferase domain-containing protein [Lampropedia cohaerens]|uniref:phosphatidylglycerol lysyltransferase domain-containing protein n=1 Tax=Lampropedia cohaerens TaxID=1610491 RepID=UPI00069A79C3|nr:phosphatidylglycerol lysyltransferase domain-containing protein [Lampropedia cohaerens]